MAGDSGARQPTRAFRPARRYPAADQHSSTYVPVARGRVFHEQGVEWKGRCVARSDAPALERVECREAGECDEGAPADWNVPATKEPAPGPPSELVVDIVLAWDT